MFDSCVLAGSRSFESWLLSFFRTGKGQHFAPLLREFHSTGHLSSTKCSVNSCTSPTRYSMKQPPSTWETYCQPASLTAVCASPAKPSHHSPHQPDEVRTWCFLCGGPTLWKALSEGHRQTNSYITFTRDLNTYIFTATVSCLSPKWNKLNVKRLWLVCREVRRKCFYYIYIYVCVCVCVVRVVCVLSGHLPLAVLCRSSGFTRKGQCQTDCQYCVLATLY